MFLDATFRLFKVLSPNPRHSGTASQSISFARNDFEQTASRDTASRCSGAGAEDPAEAASFFVAVKMVRSFVPMLQPNIQLSSSTFIGWVLLWFCVLVPVPITRIMLQDHTADQVLVGCFFGMMQALVWFSLLLLFENRSKARTGRQVFGLLQDHPDRSNLNGSVVGFNPRVELCVPKSDASLFSEAQSDVNPAA